MTEETKQKELIPYREPTGIDAVKAFIPGDFPSVWRFSELLAESGDMVPKAYVGNPAKISTAIFFGFEIGLLPLQALQSIAVINGKPSIYGDAALALVRASGFLEDFEEIYEGDFFLADGKPNPNFKAVCKITRKGAKRPTISEFSIGDAMMAGLWIKDGPWKQYPKRMLKMRARAFGLRDEFTDVLRGLGIAEEVSDYDDGPRDITPAKELEPPAPKSAQHQDGDDDGSDAGGSNEPGKKKRGRPAKDKNRYQEEAGGQVIDGEAVKTAEQKPAEEAKPAKEEEAPAPSKQAEPKEEEAPAPSSAKQETVSASSEKPKTAYQVHQEWFAEFTKDLDNELKSYLYSLDKTFMLAQTIDDLKNSWENSVKKKWSDEQHLTLRDFRKHHKARFETPPAEENPPAPGQQEEAGPAHKMQGDFSGFLHELEMALGACTSPDQVTKIFAEYTEEPLRLGLITEKQMDEDVRPLCAEAMGRVEL